MKYLQIGVENSRPFIPLFSCYAPAKMEKITFYPTFVEFFPPLREIGIGIRENYTFVDVDESKQSMYNPII